MLAKVRGRWGREMGADERGGGKHGGEYPARRMKW